MNPTTLFTGSKPTMIPKIKEAIQAAIPDAQIYVFGEDGEHFQAIVIALSFESLSLVKQHQLILNALKTEFGTNEVHALALKTFTPIKWDAEKHNYNLALAR